MKCVIIDDEPKAIEVLVRYVERIPGLELLASFREPLKALEMLQSGKVNLLFLDINMPGLSGLQLIKTITPRPMIIFTTAYSEHALESYEVRALDYLLKPISFERFVTAIARAQEEFMRNEEDVRAEVVNFKSGHLTYRIKLDDLLFLEKDGNYFNVYTKNKKFLIRENMTDILAVLPPGRFIRVHKSYIVSVSKIEVIESHQLLIETHKIPIGKMYREALDKIVKT